MIVVLAAWVEWRVTDRALKTALQILLDGQFGAAGTAENRPVVPFTLGPNLYRMVCQNRVAIFARIKHTAAPHLDGDDVGWPVIVLAPSPQIKFQATHFAQF